MPDVYSMVAEYEISRSISSATRPIPSSDRNHKRAIFGREGTISFAGKGIDVKPEPNFRSKFEKRHGEKELHLEREPTDARPSA